MAEQLGRRLRDMICNSHDLEAMGSNPAWIELGVRSISVKVLLEQKVFMGFREKYNWLCASAF